MEEDNRVIEGKSKITGLILKSLPTNNLIVDMLKLHEQQSRSDTDEYYFIVNDNDYDEVIKLIDEQYVVKMTNYYGGIPLNSTDSEVNYPKDFKPHEAGKKE